MIILLLFLYLNKMQGLEDEYSKGFFHDKILSNNAWSM